MAGHVVRVALVLAFLAGCNKVERLHERAGGMALPPAVDVPSAIDPKFARLKYSVEMAGVDENGLHVGVVRVSPDYAVDFAGGILVGGDRGEWGGELIYFDKNGVRRDLLDKNVRGIFLENDSAIVFTGIDHLDQNDGEIFILRINNDRVVERPRLIHRLMGAPKRIDKEGSGYSILIEGYWGRASRANGEQSAELRCFFMDESYSLKERSCRT